VLPIGMSGENKNKLAPALEPAAMRAIGGKLRAMYNIIAEGAPERFVAILLRSNEPSDEGSTFAG
jgi:hypothetical protein